LKSPAGKLWCCPECQFADLIERIERDISEEILPPLLQLLCVTDGADRKAVAERLKRVKRMLQ
jgi:hypothetical protein